MCGISCVKESQKKVWREVIYGSETSIIPRTWSHIFVYATLLHAVITENHKCGLYRENLKVSYCSLPLFYGYKCDKTFYVHS